MRWSISEMAIAAIVGLVLNASVSGQGARPLVPGTGIELTNVGDDFEDPDWKYIPNNPKSSEDINEQQNNPIGKSANGRWFEGIKRGHPDVVKRVATPPDGLPGSEGALLMQSLFTGIPNRPSFVMHQEDFIANVQYRNGGPLSVSQTPSTTTRVFLPPIDQWEKRSGPQFAFRAAVETTKLTEKKKAFFASSEMENEVYWPGLFIVLESRHQSKQEHDYAYLRVRAAHNGGDFKGKEIAVTGWWTMGLSFTPDGMIHYYAKPGVEDLTEADYLTSQYPYGYRCERFRAFFYNVVNGDNGKTWTTPWIVDDPKVYVVRNGTRTASRK